MATLKKRSDFVDTEEGREIMLELQQMTSSSQYTTASAYSPNSLLHPDNRISFEDKHMDYIINHPALDARVYLANIKLMTRVR